MTTGTRQSALILAISLVSVTLASNPHFYVIGGPSSSRGGNIRLYGDTGDILSDVPFPENIAGLSVDALGSEFVMWATDDTTDTRGLATFNRSGVRQEWKIIPPTGPHHLIHYFDVTDDWTTVALVDPLDRFSPTMITAYDPSGTITWEIPSSKSNGIAIDNDSVFVANKEYRNNVGYTSILEHDLATGQVIGEAIELDLEFPGGLALDVPRDRLYVINQEGGLTSLEYSTRNVLWHTETPLNIYFDVAVDTLTGNLFATGLSWVTEIDFGGDVLQTWVDENLNLSGVVPLGTAIADSDVNGDLTFDVADIDAISAAIAHETNDMAFDLTGDNRVDQRDADIWLNDAGLWNLENGNIYSLGDANLDGFVDVSDFNIWNANKFSTGTYSKGDFNSDGFVDVSDFNIWNENRFAAARPVPEPSNWATLLVTFAALALLRRTSVLGQAQSAGHHRLP